MARGAPRRRSSGNEPPPGRKRDANSAPAISPSRQQDAGARGKRAGLDGVPPSLQAASHVDAWTRSGARAGGNQRGGSRSVSPPAPATRNTSQTPPPTATTSTTSTRSRSHSGTSAAASISSATAGSSSSALLVSPPLGNHDPNATATLTSSSSSDSTTASSLHSRAGHPPNSVGEESNQSNGSASGNVIDLSNDGPERPESEFDEFSAMVEVVDSTKLKNSWAANDKRKLLLDVTGTTLDQVLCTELASEIEDSWTKYRNPQKRRDWKNWPRDEIAAVLVLLYQLLKKQYNGLEFNTSD